MTLSAPTRSTASGTLMLADTSQKKSNAGGALVETAATIGVAISSKRRTIDIFGSLTRLWRRMTNTSMEIRND